VADITSNTLHVAAVHDSMQADTVRVVTDTIHTGAAQPFDPTLALTTARRMANSLVASVPRLLAAVMVLVVVFFIARGVRALITRAARRDGAHRVLEQAIGRIVQAVVVLVGLLLAMTVAFPSFTAGNLVSSLGIGGVAIGFAFKDIFQNFLAGLLLLVTKPFNVGDEIRFREYEGIVEDIQTRATYLRTSDHRRIVIPNSDLFVNSVTVNTATKLLRIQSDVRISYADDADRAKEIIGAIMVATEGVSPDPKGDVIVAELAPTWVLVRARWWVDPHTSSAVIQDRLLGEVKRQLQAAGMQLHPRRLKLQQET
jgi:small conductance mechanosensitive channel